MDIQINWLDILGAIINIRFFEENFGIWNPRNLMKFAKSRTDSLSIKPEQEAKKVWVKTPGQQPKLETVIPTGGFNRKTWQKFYDDLSDDDKTSFLKVFAEDLAKYTRFTKSVKIENGQLFVNFLDVWQLLINGFDVFSCGEPEFMEFLKSKGFANDEDEDGGMTDESWEMTQDPDQILAFFETLGSDDQRIALSKLQEDWDHNVNEY